MKLFTISLSLLISANCFSQADFDYEFYTTHAIFKEFNIGPFTDTVGSFDKYYDHSEMTLLRKIKKEANMLKIISINNSADCITYQLLTFVGWQAEAECLVYTSSPSVPAETLWVNPIKQIILIKDSSGNTIRAYY